jgi:hypothetical protein
LCRPVETSGAPLQESEAARTDIQADNWHGVSAGELGLNPLGQQGSLQYSLVNGYYQAQDSTDAFNGDPSEADALILTGWVNKKFTLLVSFAGTDQASDVNDFVNFNDHYKKFAPLISAIKSYIDNNGVDQIFVSGHSLGAAMAQYFIEDAQFQNDPHFQARARGRSARPGPTTTHTLTQGSPTLFTLVTQLGGYPPSRGRHLPTRLRLSLHSRVFCSRRALAR